MTISFENTDQCCIEFRRIAGISNDDWTEADIPWSLLADIGRDYVSQAPSLSSSATMYADAIQAIQGVHSVRWRVKDVVNLLAKIIRKRIKREAKYMTISLEDYHEVVTDLVGIRALHLLKSEVSAIHVQINPMFDEKEPPVAYIRKGDPDELSKAYESIGFEVKIHPEGYRSIHYVKTVKPFNKKLNIEIQIRTVFEEGWSEIDHRVRYPNFSQDRLVLYASQILNRLSGMADEMSTYAMELTKSLSDRALQIEEFRKERDDALLRIDELVQIVDNLKDGDGSKSATIEKLKGELVALRIYAARDSSANALAGLGASPNLLGFPIGNPLLPEYPENALAVHSAKVESLIRGMGAAQTKKE